MKQISIWINGELRYGPATFEGDVPAWFQKLKDKRILIDSTSYEEQVEVAPAVIAEDGTVVTEARYETRVVEVEANYTVEIVDVTAKVEQERVNAEALAFLAATDFKVLRHIRENALLEPTSMSEDEYLELERQRHIAAKSVK